MATAPAPPVTVAVLFEDDEVRIDHLVQPNPSKVLVIVFDPLLYLAAKPHFGQDFLRKIGVDVVAVRKKSENFYQPLSRETFVGVVQPLLARYRRVVGYGSSLGAYAALYYCRDLDCDVVASSPRVSVHPRFGAKVWQRTANWRHQAFGTDREPRCRATVIYDPKEPIDRRYIEGEVLPQFGHAQVLRVPYSGHPSNHFLSEIGFIAPFVRAVIAGTEPPRVDRRLRTRSATYFQVLAELCAQRAKPRWAETLIERSLALNAKNLLAQRTRARIQMLRGKWAEAVASLEQALAVSPNDALTQSMLAKARDGLSGSLPTAPAASSPALPPRWRRLRGWLARRR
jgi:hypothetical protein